MEGYYKFGSCGRHEREITKTMHHRKSNYTKIRMSLVIMNTRVGKNKDEF